MPEAPNRYRGFVLDGPRAGKFYEADSPRLVFPFLVNGRLCQDEYTWDAARRGWVY